MKLLKNFFAFSLVVFLGLQSCQKDNGVITETPPELPPQASFIPDFSDFQNDKAIADSSRIHWVHSAIKVGFWNTVIFVGMAVPVASYAESFNHDAEYQGGTTWLWQYSFKDIWGIDYTAKLYGTVNVGTIDWEMYITKDGFFEDFLWYTGVMQSDGSSVTWVLYESPSEPNEFLQIVWNETTNTTGNITFTNIRPGDVENGGYIKYGNDSETDLNAYYLIYNKGQENLTEIEWSQYTKNGRVKDEIRFGDTEWHCWDENFFDIDCN